MFGVSFGLTPDELARRQKARDAGRAIAVRKIGAWNRKFRRKARLRSVVVVASNGEGQDRVHVVCGHSGPPALDTRIVKALRAAGLYPPIRAAAA